MADPLTLPSIQAAIRAIQTRLNRATSAGDNWLLFEGDAWDKRACESYLLDAWVLLVDLIARLNHGPLLEFAKDEFEKCKNNPTASEMGPDEPFLIWSGQAYNLMQMVQDLYVSDDPKTSDPKNVDHLLAIIRNSEYYITSRAAFGWIPCREDDVHRRLEGLLKCTYTDILTKPPLAKPIKGFIPDSGIPSLNTLLEYKFIETEAKGRTVLDEILADIGGYQTDAYDTFVFVIYETVRLFAEDEWLAGIAASKPRNRVEAIVIHGMLPTDDDKTLSSNLQDKRKASAPAKQTDKKQSTPKDKAT